MSFFSYNNNNNNSNKYVNLTLINSIKTGAAFNNVNNFQFLLQNSADNNIDINAQDQDGWTALYWCCDYFNDLLRVRNPPDPDKFSIPFAATEQQWNATYNKKFARYIQTTDWIQYELFNIDEIRQRLYVAKLLLKDPKIDVNLKTTLFGWSPLHLCCDRNHIAIAKNLIMHKQTKINLKTDSGGYTPLHLCCKKNNIKIATALLHRQDLDINTKDDYNHSALYYCFIHNHLDLAGLLMQRPGIDQNDVATCKKFQNKKL